MNILAFASVIVGWILWTAEILHIRTARVFFGAYWGGGLEGGAGGKKSCQILLNIVDKHVAAGEE